MHKSLVVMLLSFLFSSQNTFASCEDNELPLQWPLGGVDGINWVINNYVDLDPSNGLRDYKGNTGSKAKTYNGHNGIDIDLPNFRAMDYGAWTAWAAAPGEVIDIQQNLYDRNMEAAPDCGPWNHVYVKHDNGYVTMYGHLKFNGVLVKVGDKVSAGQPLGYIGSSGCSSTAHLHFEVRNCDNKPVDPFLKTMWVTPPVYDTPLNFMDISLRKGEFPEPSENSPPDALMKDPPPNIFTIPTGSYIGIGLSMAGGGYNDSVDVLVRRPDGSVFIQFTPIHLTDSMRHWWPRWWVRLPSPMDIGIWKVEVRANNVLVSEKNFRSQPTNDAVVMGNADVTYQQTFLSLSKDQYSAAIVDGSEASEGGARISAIYRRKGGVYRTIHNANGTNYQIAFNQAVAAGLQLTSVDNYIRNGEPVLAAVFSTPVINDWRAYHLTDREEHQQRFNQLTSQGYRPYIISVAAANSRYYISAAYTKAPSRGWIALYGLTAQEYQNEVDRQITQHRAPAYIDVYDDGGTPKFSVIWTAEANDWPWLARHNLSEAQFYQVNEERALAGMKARAITSYLLNGQRLFAGIWSAAP